MITPVAFDSIDYHTYTIFAVINALIVPSVYFCFPETAYRSLEEMDLIFQKVSGWRAAFTVVHQARVEPRHYGKNGELLISFDDVDEKHILARGDSDGSGNQTAVTGVLTSTTNDEEHQRQAL